ncbi:N-acetyltransferase (plasmid) [Streptomyces sp. SGAir0957]
MRKGPTVHVLSSPVADTDIRIRTATSADGDTIVELASLVDLHVPSEAVPAALAPMRFALTTTDNGPLSHRENHFLIAEDREGRPVGAIVCGPPNWIAKPGRAPGLVRRRLVHRLSTVHALAVRPDHRGRGIGRALLQQAEKTFHDAGYTALTLRHERELTRFYERLGYTSSSRLSLALPTGELLTLVDRGWKHAFKALSSSASTTTVQGLPTLTGVLSD